MYDCYREEFYRVLKCVFFSCMLQAAKEAAALKAALEKQVEDLTLQLELEKRMRVNMFL